MHALFLAVSLAVSGQTLLSNPRWKIQVLIYDRIDFQFTDASGRAHHVTTSMTQEEKNVALAAAKKFLETDVPALTSGNMVPLGTIKFVPHPLTTLARVCGDDYGFWPDPAATAPDRDPASFDSSDRNLPGESG